MQIVITILVKDHVFFWDTIQLGSKHAHWYFENNFRYIFLPPEIDSGHPPVFGLYLACWWKLLGKTLWVSHVAMLPFLIANVYLFYKVAGWFVGKRPFIFILLLLMTIDPTLAAQSILVSPDVILVTFFLWGLLSVCKNNPIGIGMAVIGLGMISMRGMMVGVFLYVFQLLNLFLFEKKGSIQQVFKKLLPYLPGGFIALVFLFFHYRHTGWIGYHADSPWSPAFEQTDLKGVVYNAGILTWRFLDFGRIFIWIGLFGSLLLFWKNKIKIDSKGRMLLILLGLSLLLLTPTALFYKSLSAHRYMLPIFILLNFCCWYFIFLIKEGYQKISSILTIIAVAGLLTGNFWVYSAQIAQGWDSTLAHVPYYSLRSKMIRYITEKEIPLEEVGTTFPEIGSWKYKDLSEEEDGFSRLNFSENRYIYYASVMNDFSDEQLEKLKKEWKEEKSFCFGRVCTILYKRDY
ncbi:MAG: glycosyltransferase family 39 protein [Bacteroidetes bacterium]|nr:glycosyltransferase family 39 protein [Bacteroidota bacterium]